MIDRIYTDGGCINNPGSGGWGVVVKYKDGSVTELGDRQDQTTNNRMEMQAAIEALKLFRDSDQRESIQLLTDSKYVIDGITKWIKGWKRKGWKKSSGAPVLNQDLWQEMDKLNHPAVEWTHVKGHSGEEGNERADAIANSFARGKAPILKTARFTSENQKNTQKLQNLPKTGVIPSTSVTELSVDSDENSIVIPSVSRVNVMTDSSGVEEIVLSRHERVQQLSALIESLRIADEIADKGYFISSSELADLMDVNASAVTSRGHEWTWRNWIVSRVKREGNQILWQLDRIMGDAEAS
ncbi:ribonuclease HI [[Limnothrix rosea] IAM M-220]|nr:ribonuclease HI [[Limnothrix rosea] IAM M-220]